MPTPSLILVPARFKTGKLYTPLATTSGGVVLGASGDFNVTRATTATRVNASGFIEVVASGIPRLDYPIGGGCPALLVEPSAQNLVVQSENFTTTWGQTGLNITSGFTSPSNNNSGTLIEATANTGRLRQTFAAGLTSGVTSTFSLFAKLGTQSSGVTLVFQEGTGTNYVSGACQSFRLDTGAVGTSGTLGAGFTIIGSGIENYGNGWYRCSFTVRLSYTPSSANLTIRPTSVVTANLPVTASGDSCYIFGAQLETGSVATSYIPTTTAAVTRNADVINVSGAVSGCIGQTEGTIYAEVDVQFNNRNADIIGLASGSSANGFYLVIRSSSVIELRIRQNSTNALIFQRTGAYPVGINKIAVSYKNGDFAISLNGTTTQVDTTTITMPSVAITRASVVPSINFTLDQSIRVRSAALYTTRLTDSELAALTTL